MNADLERLISLQKLDTQIARKSTLLQKLPEELKAGYTSCEEAKNRLKAFDEEMNADTKKRRDLESEVEDLQDKIAKAKTKLSQVKTNVEYRAILKEQETFENKIKELEDKQLELMENVEKKSGGRKELEEKLAEEEKKYAVIKTEKEAAIAEVKAALDGLKAERVSTLSNITPSVLKTYERVLKQRDGIGVSMVRNNLCQGCNQLIPPQLYYQIRTSDELHQCPHCNRYLYFARVEAEKEVQ